MNRHSLSTTKVITLGIVMAIIANIPFYAWIINENWSQAQGFPLQWIGAGMVYIATFFHEIGHTLLGWFYGYPTVPTFDFQHGGGMAWALAGQKMPILISIWLAMAYGLWALREHKMLQAGIICLAILNVSFAFNGYHMIVIDFMGPAFEPLVAAFFLYRAFLNLAPRGDLERFLNAFFGFGMIFQVFINAYGLLKSTAYRLVYYEQKGSHGFGDFDKIANKLAILNFSGAVSVWILVTIICLIIPIILFIRDR